MGIKGQLAVRNDIRLRLPRYSLHGKATRVPETLWAARGDGRAPEVCLLEGAAGLEGLSCCGSDITLRGNVKPWQRALAWTEVRAKVTCPKCLKWAAKVPAPPVASE